MRLAVGTAVTYPPHGVGRVAARERRVVLGVETEVVLIEFAGGLSVTLPLDRARALLRPRATEADLGRVQKALGESRPPSDDVWSTRFKLLQEQLRRGDLLELAAIVRDGARRDSTADGSRSKLSVSERALCVKARELLAGEIGVVRGLGTTEANLWIDEQLAPLGS